MTSFVQGQAPGVIALCLALSACGTESTILVEPLAVVNWSPSDGALCVAPEVNLFNARITFSSDVEPETLGASISMWRLAGGADEESEVSLSEPSYDKLNRTVRIQLSEDLSYSSWYELRLAETLTGSDGGKLTAAQHVQFETRDPGGCL